MSGSTTNLDQVSATAVQRETTINANFDAASPATLFGRRASTTSALTWGYYGGTFNVSGLPTVIANGTIALTGGATNYLYATAAGVVTKVTAAPSGWPGPLAAGAVALYEIVAGASSVTSYTDYRTPSSWGSSSASAAPNDAQYLVVEPSGSLTNERQLIAGSGITFTEGGGSPPTSITVSAQSGAPVDQTYYVGGPTTGLSHARTLKAGSGITFTEGGGSPPTEMTVSASNAAKVLQFACSDETTELTTGTAKITLRAPYAMTLTAVRASLTSYAVGSPGGGSITVDINVNGSSILSTKLTIDAGEKTSTTAATPAVISSASIADDDEITVDIDSVGNGCAGLKVALIGT